MFSLNLEHLIVLVFSHGEREDICYRLIEIMLCICYLDISCWLPSYHVGDDT